MKTYPVIFAMTLLATGLNGCADSTPKGNLEIARTNSVSVTATVTAVDLKTRMVTLRNAEGKLFTVHAGQEVINLPQVQVDDEVVLTAIDDISVRMAESGELWDVNLQETAFAEPGSKPGAIEISDTVITATIEALDKVRETVALRMPDGAVKIVKVKDPANLDKVAVGDTLMIARTEAVGISVQRPAH